MECLKKKVFVMCYGKLINFLKHIINFKLKKDTFTLTKKNISISYASLGKKSSIPFFDGHDVLHEKKNNQCVLL